MKLFAQGFLICSLAAALIACQQDVSREVTRPVVTVMVLPELNHQAIQSFPAVIQAKDLTDLSFRQGGEIV